ncbi:MAG: hypothetical protein K5629_01920 [Eubacteriales bacterium]|nr:hypothetical protein [Eubacteriales bacterium]
MKKACVGFGMKDPVEAYRHMKLKLIEDYGSYAYGNILHTWDDGKRYLCRCKSCGGYVLVQNSEFHDMSGGNDCNYMDYFPVDSPEAADELNRKFNGFEIEYDSGIRFLIKDDHNPHWSTKIEE